MYPKPCRNRKPEKRYLPLAPLLQTPYRAEKQRKLHRKHTNMEAYEPTSYAFFFCPKIEKLLILGVHLTAELLNDLIDRIVIHASDRSSGHRKQKIEIYYKAAGIINISDEDCVAEDGRKERWRNTKSA